LKIAKVIFVLFFAVISSYAQTDNYILSDSLEFSDMITGGLARVLKFRDSPIDTIDSAFGINSLDGQKIVYHKVEIFGMPLAGNSYEGTFSDYIICKNGRKTLLRNSLAYFDDWFSSPSVIGNYILYWGFKKEKGSKYLTVYAMRYEIDRRRIDSIFLFSDKIETDNSGLFYRPVEDLGGYLFEYEDKSWLVEESFSGKQLIK
jgi:hypothetical protein